ncbi:MAG: creatininase family protein [Ruminococcaceae bacterium]|nr:creatininase family protein [Oscillospiraceae bacterium]
MIWEYLREEEFDAAIKASAGVCVVPVGCMEKHGQHLPVGTDSILATEIARRAAAREPVCVFPTIHFGEKTGAGEFRGTVIFSNELRQKILEETCREIHRNGFHKILLFNGHGGNQSMLSQFARSTLYEDAGYLIYDYAPGSDFPTPNKLLSGNYGSLTKEDKDVLKAYVEAKKRYGHACFIETGWIYASHPELVRLDKADQESGSSTHRFDEFTKRKINSPFAWMADYPNSYAGDMHDGMNERIADAMMEYSVTKTAEVFRFLKEETISEDYYREWQKKQNGC